MNHIKISSAIGLLLVFLMHFTPMAFASANQVNKNELTIYVAPNGDDKNEGKIDQPLASLIGARDMIRKHKKNTGHSGPITVLIRGGAYQMLAPLELNPEDGGSQEAPVVYKAYQDEKPVFSGGKKLSGFKVNELGIWELELHESQYYKWRFDQLYVNGKRATLARTPNEGFMHIAAVKQNDWIKGTGRAVEKAQHVFSFDEENFSHLKGVADEDLDNIRLRAYHKWNFTMRYLDKLDKDSAQVYTSGGGMPPWNPIKEGGRIVFENFAAALDEAGEWYLNSKGTLYYIPLPGEQPEDAEVIAPVLDNLVLVKGDAANGESVEHVRFEGLSFMHCHYAVPPSGSEPSQAAAMINAAVMIEGANHVDFVNCEISKTGQHALWYGKGCHYSTVERSYLHDLGGGGIYLGETKAHEGANHTSHIKLHNNIIQTGGLEYPTAVGVWVGHSSDNEISNNDIGNFYYTGISVGWVWGYAESNAKRNKIVNNHIHHIGWTLLSDMAAVYTLGKSEGTVISNNIVHHVHAYSYGGWGLYTDEGSTGIVMENNLVYSTKTGGFHQHYGANNTIRNNIFAYAKMYQAQCTRVEEHRSFDFMNNIIVFDEGAVLQGAWEKIDIAMDNNMYWNTGGEEYDFNGKSFSEWQKFGQDQHSRIMNPRFKDPENFNFEFSSKKAIRRIGFEPFDLDASGVYGNETWIEKAKLPSRILAAFDEQVKLNMGKE
ncbi:right-handed parallel beta-helix repeat-containing protein [Cyclobacterium qasimii]|uniref:Right handed beta helix domain-containing protein n=2 Tax=Cyclobacterium qasimii TaxID=1350429 RepID=S7VEQ9_9BACT|nr:right-handed parallel beta-helix repeat-containing protein [Cyclobacterium qasimii]EPR68042.1 hypothetical protein ADICYQ_3114 [Cyclobacterium qasimii M12-11B]